MKTVVISLVFLILLTSLGVVVAQEDTQACNIQSVELAGENVLRITTDSGEWLVTPSQNPVNQLESGVEPFRLANVDEVRSITDIGEGEWLILLMDGRIQWLHDGQIEPLYDESVRDYIPWWQANDRLVVSGVRMIPGKPETLLVGIGWPDEYIGDQWYYHAVWDGDLFIPDVPGITYRDRGIVIMAIMYFMEESQVTTTTLSETQELEAVETREVSIMRTMMYSLIPGTVDMFWFGGGRWAYVVGDNDFLDPDPAHLLVGDRLIIDLGEIVCEQPSMGNIMYLPTEDFDWQTYIDNHPSILPPAM